MVEKMCVSYTIHHVSYSCNVDIVEPCFLPLSFSLSLYLFLNYKEENK